MHCPFWQKTIDVPDGLGVAVGERYALDIFCGRAYRLSRLHYGPRTGDRFRLVPDDMPAYDWICLACHAKNRAGLDACAICRCPAEASGDEIDFARTGVKPAQRLSRKQWIAQRYAEIGDLPGWKKPIAYLLQGVRFVGATIALFGLFDLLPGRVLIGLGAVALAEIAFALLKRECRPD